MKYVLLVCFGLFFICIGAIRAFNSRKGKKFDSEYTDKSFVTHFIIGIPTFLISVYYSLTTPSSDLLLVGTIIVSGSVAFVIGLHYDRIEAQREKDRENKD